MPFDVWPVAAGCPGECAPYRLDKQLFVDGALELKPGGGSHVWVGCGAVGA